MTVILRNACLLTACPCIPCSNNLNQLSLPLLTPLPDLQDRSDRTAEASSSGRATDAADTFAAAASKPLAQTLHDVSFPALCCPKFKGCLAACYCLDPLARWRVSPWLDLLFALQSGFALGRLKTGTPPRLAADTIDFSCMETQPGDVHPMPFSFLNMAKQGWQPPPRQVGVL